MRKRVVIAYTNNTLSLTESLNTTGPSCSKRRKLNELVSGQNVNCSSKYNT